MSNTWQQTIPIIVRTMINDWGTPPEYTDERLLQIITVAAKYVQFDVVLDYKYDVDVVAPSIIPDPTLENDDIFICLTSLKSACILDQSTYRTKASLEGIRAVLGPASLSVGGSAAAWQNIIEHGACKAYDDLVDHWDIANATVARAILGPFSGNKFNPEWARSQVNYYRNTFFN